MSGRPRTLALRVPRSRRAAREAAAMTAFATLVFLGMLLVGLGCLALPEVTLR